VVEQVEQAVQVGIVIVKELNKASGSWPLRAQFSSQKQGTWPYFFRHFDYLVIAGGGGGGTANVEVVEVELVDIELHFLVEQKLH
jgi:hypothetical protein